MKRKITRRAAQARLSRKLAAREDGRWTLWKLTPREVSSLAAKAGDFGIADNNAVKEWGSLERLCEQHGALADYEEIEAA